MFLIFLNINLMSEVICKIKKVFILHIVVFIGFTNFYTNWHSITVDNNSKQQTVQRTVCCLLFIEQKFYFLFYSYLYNLFLFYHCH